MTYCIGIALDEGFVMTSDSRTNAGIDQVNTYSKMHRCNTNNDRSIVILGAGNLSTTQGVIAKIKRDIHEDKSENLNNFNYLSDIADYLGTLLSERIQRYNNGETQGFSPEATLLLGGEIKEEGKPGVFMIYPEGNYITTSKETAYLQIGESKYGKPVLDRFISSETSLLDAATCSMISMDSTMKSNASVGPPIEVLMYAKNSLNMNKHYCFEADNPYLRQIRQEWGNKLTEAFSTMPRLPASDHQYK